MHENQKTEGQPLLIKIMHKIVRKRILNPAVEEIVVEAPYVARKCQPGQFIIIIVEEGGERIPLTIADYNREEQSVTMIYQVVGHSTKLLQQKNVGDYISDVAGPLGLPCVDHKPKKVLAIGGGVGAAPLYPQIKMHAENGAEIDVVLGGRSFEFVILQEEFSKLANHVFVATDDGSLGTKGFVTTVAQKLLEEGNQYDEVIAIGPIPMMKAVVNVVKPFNIPISVSLNPLMVDGTGMCGGCRVTIAGKTKFACVDGPDFNGYEVDFDEITGRQGMYKDQENGHKCRIGLSGENNKAAKPAAPLAAQMKGKFNMQPQRTPMPELDPIERSKSFGEVAMGYSVEEAINEAKRCIQCKRPSCVSGCPVNVNIPEFIGHIAQGDFQEAYKSIKSYNSLPAVCGRVCPQENQCEAICVRGKKDEPVAIGRLERFIADYAREHIFEEEIPQHNSGRKVAVIGAGPAGIACAGELAKKGHEVVVFEALHTPGGVLMYGIPEFRLPKQIVREEIDSIKKMGVKIEKNVIVGKSLTVEDLKVDGFEAIFISTGAGLPRFLNIEGENLNGVYSANEFLTRVNLMESFKRETPSPVQKGDKVAVVGGGNVAMDACRTALRLGAEEVFIIYRRGEDELPARAEEIEHAKEEGIQFKLLANPVKIHDNGNGWVGAIENQQMELGEPDASGRRRPVPVEGETFMLDVNKVVIAVGQSPNPLITQSTKGLDLHSWGGIIVDEQTMKTSKENVYAGGDVVTGAATVILAMGAGKTAAQAIDEQLNS
ncbi:glutamate synthase (NADPH/NADH) small chain [Draconibacterium orientale]|uniref:Glutamate synthase (NADPH/NADH) small chain n=2 Tax=Draconibacterium orientale TaxID=1168034 RepID=A0A1I0G0E8_9BACT|nr:glutamate synthase (NADPH/NADH) small chain [Draconibacterium orientale]